MAITNQPGTKKEAVPTKQESRNNEIHLPETRNEEHQFNNRPESTEIAGLLSDLFDSIKQNYSPKPGAEKSLGMTPTALTKAVKELEDAKEGKVSWITSPITSMDSEQASMSNDLKTLLTKLYSDSFKSGVTDKTLRSWQTEVADQSKGDGELGSNNAAKILDLLVKEGYVQKK
jgi:hypothetical protein